MQYGAEVSPYQRTKKVDKHKKKNALSFNYILGITLYFVSALLISRVKFINLMAPFGIAFLLAVSFQKEYKYVLFSAFGTLIGYVSLYNSIKDLPIYITIIGTILTARYISKNIKNTKTITIMYIVIFSELVLYKAFILNLSINISLLNSIFEIACLFPIYFIINYSIICFRDINTMHLYSNEEIISMAITLALAVSGTWGISINNVSLRNFIALTLIVIIGYVKGSTSAAAIGIAMGAIVGLGSKDMLTFISVYGLCGLIAGTFKDTGKLITGTAYIIGFCVLKFYSNIGNEFKIIEALLGLIVFWAIPKKIYRKLEVELDAQKKRENIQDNQIGKIKSLVNDKLENFSDILFNVGDVLAKLAENQKLAMKGKSDSLVQNLADRVCSNCNMRNVCWKKETYYTYNALAELIENYQDNKKGIPNELQKKCVKRTQMIKNTKELTNNFIVNEMWQKRLGECRQVLSSQMNNMGSAVKEIIDDFDERIKFSNLIDNNIRRILNKNDIKYKDVFCYNDEKNRLIISLSMDICGGRQICSKEILPLINKVTNKLMRIRDDGCNIDKEKEGCRVVFEETPKYHVKAFGNTLCKDGERYNGDSYVFEKLKDGNFISIISDGMGSGPEAGKESTAVVELIQKFTEAGFSKMTAINTINSIMGIKFSEDEKFSTVDLTNIDLYEGKIDFMKVGSVASFIKREEAVEVIKSKTLPIGVLDKVDVDIENRDIKNGDIIVMISDGVLDYEAKSAGKVDWILNYLRETDCIDPEKLCKKLINQVKKLSNGKVKDDVSIVVQKVYSLY
ncbi:stage II sporulation protein E [Clostridium oceanicum]|uniref:Stage II sporulation protein E n=1 Tax=Clostridium oceanicum TaxID=1543 RepID=A0ABP3V1A4_9CLOT